MAVMLRDELGYKPPGELLNKVQRKKKKVHTGRFRPKVQPLTLFWTILAEKIPL